MPTVITFHVLIQFAWMEFGVECPYFVFFGRVIELFEVSVSFSTWVLLSIQIILNCIYPCRLFCVHRQELCLVFYEGYDLTRTRSVRVQTSLHSITARHT